MRKAQLRALSSSVSVTRVVQPSVCAASSWSGLVWNRPGSNDELSWLLFGVHKFRSHIVKFESIQSCIISITYREVSVHSELFLSAPFMFTCWEDFGREERLLCRAVSESLVAPSYWPGHWVSDGRNGYGWDCWGGRLRKVSATPCVGLRVCVLWYCGWQMNEKIILRLMVESVHRHAFFLPVGQEAKKGRRAAPANGSIPSGVSSVRDSGELASGVRQWSHLCACQQAIHEDQVSRLFKIPPPPPPGEYTVFVDSTHAKS